MHGPDTTHPDTTLSDAVGQRRRHADGSRRQRFARISTHRPSKRAIVGGLLVTIAGLVAWAATDASAHHSGRSIVVATRSIAPGERIDTSALEVRTVEIDESLASRDFDATAQVVDAVALGPIAAGDPIPRSAVLPDASGSNLRQFSFPVDRDRSLNGDLRAGERVDVMATFGTGSDATTTVIARNALVLRVNEQRTGALGSSNTSILTIGLSSADQVLDAVHAAQVAELTVVRSTLSSDTTAGRNSTTGPNSRATGARS